MVRKTPREAAISDYNAHFMGNFRRVFASLAQEEDRFWLAGPSAYVFSLSGHRFAVDLQIRRKKDMEALASEAAQLCGGLEFVLITHQHDDHMCLPLMRSLRDTPIRWYIPYGVPQRLIEESGLRAENIVYVRDGDEWTAGELRIQAFHSPHARPEVDFVQCGYAITSPSGKLLFPGDVRDYSYTGYPDFGQVDICFSHVWAGNNSIDPEAYMPLLEEFAEFSARFGAKTYSLGHLYELLREPDKLWDFAHAGMAAKLIYELLPDSDVIVPRIGRSYRIGQA